MRKDVFENRLMIAEKEAVRFLARILDYRNNNSYSTTKESAAIKRASMDLTRSLSDLRRSTYED